MYFYIHKNHNNENEQAQLLEVCSDACIYFGNGRGSYGINTYEFLIKVAAANCPATFSFYQSVRI